jgi:hypothetical protein
MNSENRVEGVDGDGDGVLEPRDPSVDQAVAAIAELARKNPRAVLLGAGAVGFLLGGGLTPRLLGAVALLAARRYFAQTVRETLDGVLRERLGTQPHR